MNENGNQPTNNQVIADITHNHYMILLLYVQQQIATNVVGFHDVICLLI